MAKQNKTELQNSGYNSAIGYSQILLGIIAIIVASLFARFTILLLGLILSIRGILDIYQSTRPGRPKMYGVLFTGFAALITGLLLLILPQTGASVLTLLLSGIFLLGGIQKVLSPWRRDQPSDSFTVMTGAISLLLGILLLVVWPVQSFELLGILVGIEIMLNGMTISLTGKAIRKMSPSQGKRTG